MPHSLADWLAYLERLHPVSIDMGLERVAAVRDRLSLAPAFPIISVAGTNGKGSTCAMIEAILSAAGYRVGLYTSPHLLRYNERVRVAQQAVDDVSLTESFSRIEAARLPESLTYFEFGTLAAMDIFLRENVELAVLEVGLGGRLDAVNVFEPTCAVVTSVDFDHMDYLGPDRESIGREKSGIFRQGVPAICGDEDPPASLISHAASLGAPLFVGGRDFGFNQRGSEWDFWSFKRKRFGLPYPALRGSYQLVNAATALAAVEQLEHAVPIDMGAIRRGLTEVSLPGRFQILPGRPMVILDVAHNPHAARGLSESLHALSPGGRVVAVFSMLKDKDIAGVAQELKAQVNEWLVASLSGARGADAVQIEQALRSIGVDVPISRFDAPATAFQSAMRCAGQDDKILVFGSFYTVGAIMHTQGTIHCLPDSHTS